MWTEITDEIGINELLRLYGNFHDSCLRDIYISTQDFVDERKAMHFENVLTASLLFQRQVNENGVIELKFEHVDQLNYNPDKANYNVILDTTLKLSNELFYWADFEDWEIGNNDAVWISGKKLYWRLRPELKGNIKRLSDE